MSASKLNFLIYSASSYTMINMFFYRIPFISEIKHLHERYTSLFIIVLHCLHLIAVNFYLRFTFKILETTRAQSDKFSSFNWSKYFFQNILNFAYERRKMYLNALSGTCNYATF